MQIDKYANRQIGRQIGMQINRISKERGIINNNKALLANNTNKASM